MATWQKEIPVEETKSDKLYFIARGSGERGYLYWSRLKSNKKAWSCKPGIAMRFFGGETLISDFAKNKISNPNLNLVAIEVPPDADKRWSRR